jgi:hypothetical protein
MPVSSYGAGIEWFKNQLKSSNLKDYNPSLWQAGEHESYLETFIKDVNAKLIFLYVDNLDLKLRILTKIF